MISKEEFNNLLQNCGTPTSETEEILDKFDILLPVAIKANNSIPSIGFCSANKRLMAFLSVCDVLDKFIKEGEIELGDSQYILMILLFKNKPFAKAAGQFQVLAMSQRFDTRAKAEMPRSAREWLAGIEYTGY